MPHPEAPITIPTSKSQLLDRIRRRVHALDGVTYHGLSPIFVDGVTPGKPLPLTRADVWRQLIYVSTPGLYDVPGADWQTVTDLLKTNRLVSPSNSYPHGPQQTRHGLHLAHVDLHLGKELQSVRTGEHITRGATSMLRAIEATGVPTRTPVDEVTSHGGVVSVRFYPSERMADDAVMLDTSAGADAFGTFVSKELLLHY